MGLDAFSLIAWGGGTTLETAYMHESRVGFDLPPSSCAPPHLVQVLLGRRPEPRAEAGVAAGARQLRWRLPCLAPRDPEEAAGAGAGDPCPLPPAHPRGPSPSRCLR